MAAIMEVFIVLLVSESGRPHSNGCSQDNFIFKCYRQELVFNSVAGEWNWVSSHVVSAHTTDTFKID